MDIWKRILGAALLCMLVLPAHAWIYPEHRDIATQAVTGLDAPRRAAFDRLWQEARADDEARLCGDGADLVQGLTPACLDWAALSAVAGDHACSSTRMLEWVRNADWILVVADIGAQLKEDLARIAASEQPARPEQRTRPDGLSASAATVQRALADEASRAKRLNALRTADTRLQRADALYATRADANLAHFLLPRPDTRLDPLAYAGEVLRSGAPLNAGGVYVWHHVSALQKAGRLAAGGLAPEERRRLARAALFDEAFALHFLEDMFAAGHIAGSWGDVSQRKGTHDYYNERGLEVFTWRGRAESIVALGDAHMRPGDASLAATAVRASLAQVLDAAAGKLGDAGLPHPAAAGTTEALDICKETVFPDRADRLGTGLERYHAVLADVLLDTPVPGLGPGLGAQPRSRSELGAFTGLVAGIETRRLRNGFDAGQGEGGTVNGLDVALRAGLGLEGALGDSGDGLAFAQLGYHVDGPSSSRIVSDLGSSGNFYAALPARSGLSLRLRMPYYVVPGDLLFLSPMYFADKERFTTIATGASNGGLLGWQQGWATRIGRFQFVLGRELGLTWYGLDGDQQMFVPGAFGGISQLVRFKSVYIDVPIAEYRPYRSFSADQSSTLLFQLFFGIDRPFAVRPEGGFGDAPPLRPIRQFGVRMTFDWRHYR